uniref:VWFA domain-containing protein n=1 Tax=Syphacia muris TaxID=451379 RepID=A0A158R424_9BILA
NCTDAPTDVIVLIDITSESDDTFAEKQLRIIDTLRFIDENSPYKKLAYGVIAFHKRPLVLLPLTSPLSKYNQKVTEYIQSLKSRRKFETSPAKALELASEHFENFGSKDACLLVIVADDGNSTDVAKESILARKHIEDQGGSIFAIATSEHSDIHALTGYTKTRSRVYYDESDKTKFLHEVSRVIGACNDTADDGFDDYFLKPLLRGQDDGNIDLVILLDTSGPAESNFLKQKEFVTNLTSALDSSAFDDGRLRISFVPFAAFANLTVILHSEDPKDVVLEQLRKIKFTGGTTRICEAVDLGLAEIQQRRRPTATQVSLSDGHGEDFWSTVQGTTKRLHSAKMETFAVTATEDFDLGELALYAGNIERVYANPNHTEFLELISSIVNYCLNKGIENVGTVSKTVLFTEFASQQLPGESVTEKSHSEKANAMLTTNPNAAATEVVPASVEDSAVKPASEVPILIVDRPGINNSAPKTASVKTLSPSTEPPVIKETFSSNTESPVDTVETKTTPSVNEIPAKQELDRDVFTELVVKNFNKTDNVNSSDQMMNKNQQHFPNEENVKEKESSNDSVPMMTTTKAVDTEEETTMHSSVKAEEEFTDAPTISESTTIENLNSQMIHANETELPDSLMISNNETETLDSQMIHTNETDMPESLTPSINNETQTLDSIMTEANGTEMPGSSTIPDKEGTKLEELEDASMTTSTTSSEYSTVTAIQSEDYSIQGDKKGAPLEMDKECKIDLVFVIDRSATNETIFESRLLFAKNLVEHLLVKNDNMKTMQIGVVSFAGDAKVDLEFGLDRTVDTINKEIDTIKGVSDEVSLVSGIALATKFIQSTRRPNADVVMFLVSDGKAADSHEMIMKETSALHSLPKSYFYAVSFDQANSPEFLENLALFIGSERRVFVEDPTKPFIQQAETIIDKCMWNDNENEENKFSNSLSKSSSCAPIDLILMVDRTAPIPEEFNKVKTTITKFLKSITPELFDSYVNAALISFDNEPKVEKSLKTPTSQEQLIQSVMDLPQVYSSSSVAKAVSKVVDEIKNYRRPESRLIIVVYSDGGIRNCSSSNRRLIDELHKFQSEIYAVYYSPSNVQTELAKYTGSNDRIMNSTVETVLKKINIDPCRIHIESSKDAMKNTESMNIPETEGLLSPCAATSQETNAVTPSKALPVDPNCLVDLMFIIDRSESVEKEFQDQLSFAVEMVKRINSDDFVDRVRIAAVSFARSSKVEFVFGEFRNKTKVIEALSSIKHTGGSTSAVKGVNLAVDELQKNARKNARQMVVLITDGNSQDQWKDVLAAAERLHTTDAEVYAVTVSHDYFLRELELYAKSKWFVYIDARIRQFLDQAELSVSQCLSPEIPTTKLPDTTFGVEQLEEIITSTTPLTLTTESEKLLECMEDPVDLVFILDTSSSIEDVFYSEKNFAIDLIKSLPDHLLQNRIHVGLVRFASSSNLQFGLGRMRSKSDILYELERVEYTAGHTSLVAGTNEALREISSRHRPNARLIVVFISDGNSQDVWSLVQSTAKKLRETEAEIYAVTLSKAFSLDELKEYTGSEDHVYVNERINDFIKDVGSSVMDCSVDTVTEAAITSTTAKESEELLPINSATEISYATDQVDKCKYSKMDLEIIMDASTSRQDVFERQRELALSLIERLPIGTNETRVAVGVISFSDSPTLRLPLGLGRNKEVIRKEIENIEYRGGSTLTARAVELSVNDLETGHRPDAIKVVVLMNDGLSQDPWDDVLRASEKLRLAVPERFGVALGEEIDLRELRRYIGNDDRIYHDDETERFLSNVVELITGERECRISIERPVGENSPISTDDCDLPNLDVVVVFDNSDSTANLSDPSISLNRFLLLDVLGSLPDTWDSGKLKLSLISFANNPTLTVSFADDQSRTGIFKKVEGIVAQHGRANYAKAVNFAISEYEKFHRSDARGLLLIVGDGHSYDTPEQRDSVMNLLDKHMELLILAVDSGNNLDVQNLAIYTSSPDLVYNYEKNAEFARDVLKEASAPEGCEKKTGTQLDIVTKPADSIKRFESSKVTLIVIVKSKDTEANNEPSDKSSFSLFTKPETTLRTSTTRTSRRFMTHFSTNRPLTTTTTAKPRLTPTFRNLPTLGFSNSLAKQTTTTLPPEEITVNIPGCMIDILFIIDASGSVQETFERQKDLAAKILNDIRVGENNAHIAIIKFAAEEKVKTVWSFGQMQSKRLILRALKSLTFSSGVTAIDKALLQAADEYDAEGRPDEAIPIGIIFTDGFGQKDATEAANELRSMVPNMFAVAINHQYPINRPELENITGSSDRIFTDTNISQLYTEIRKFARDC